MYLFCHGCMSSLLIMRQKLNTGHYGPAPTVNVIPELDGNRVKEARNGHEFENTYTVTVPAFLEGSGR